jgi:hypothetical protein
MKLYLQTLSLGPLARSKTYVDFPLPSFGEKVGKIGQLGQA